MAQNLLVGSGALAACVVIQCLVVAVLLTAFHRHIDRLRFVPTIHRSAGLLIVAMLILFCGNLVQIAVWAWVFMGFGEFERFDNAFYHSAVNYSSLGYGDIVMSEKRRLLGALEAGNGVLMFGLTTSLLYSIVEALMRRKKELVEAGAEPGPGKSRT